MIRGAFQRRQARQRLDALRGEIPFDASRRRQASSQPARPGVLPVMGGGRDTTGTAPRPAEQTSPRSAQERGALALRLRRAGLRSSPLLFLFAAGVFSVGLCAVGTFILPSSCIPALLLIGLWIPWSYIDHRARRRAQRFSEDYPAVLLATASSVQVGLPPHQALERATRLLPAASPARLEVERLLERMRAGVSKEEAISGFAADIDLPDIELFRSAFLLVTETGGRFSPTLQRLASVTNNRMALIQMAAVTTASMRMTANVLLAIAPALVLFLSFRIPGFWDLFRNHPTANLLASLGIVIISVGYLVLRKMSAFKP